jgi:glycogen synthase
MPCLVGGVYTVLKTKAPSTVREYGNRYTLIGRLDQKTVSIAMILIPIPLADHFCRPMQNSWQ